MLSKRKRRKLAGKNMKAIISKEIEGSGESDIEETAIDSVNNANWSIIENEVLDENQEVNDLLVENNNNGVTNSVPTKCNEENTQENLIEKQSEKSQPKYVTMESFDTFYDDYIEYKHYINDILKNFPVSEDVLNEQWEASKCETSCKERIKSLENKINILQTENKMLVEESTDYMEIKELLSAGNQNKTTEKTINEKS